MRGAMVTPMLKRLGLGSLQTLNNIHQYFLAVFHFSFCKCNLGVSFPCEVVLVHQGREQSAEATSSKLFRVTKTQLSLLCKIF